jgi:hypothetical protein
MLIMTDASGCSITVTIATVWVVSGKSVGTLGSEVIVVVIASGLLANENVARPAFNNSQVAALHELDCTD